MQYLLKEDIWKTFYMLLKELRIIQWVQSISFSPSLQKKYFWGWLVLCMFKTLAFFHMLQSQELSMGMIVAQSSNFITPSSFRCLALAQDLLPLCHLWEESRVHKCHRQRWGTLLQRWVVLGLSSDIFLGWRREGASMPRDWHLFMAWLHSMSKSEVL